MENKRKHLELIHGLIGRLSSNSFQLKGWCLTVSIAILTLTIKEKNNNYPLIAFIPVFLFWILDGFYLFKERLFRSLYDFVRVQSESEITFTMDTGKFIGGRNRWINSIFSKTLILFYLSYLASMIIVLGLIKN